MDCIKQQFDVPVGFDTDVNAAALAEQQWGAGKGLQNVIYMTIGTGIGLGAIVEGRLLHGAMHSEAGHMSVFQDVEKDPFPGVCPYHRNCLEGLASGPAIKARWKVASALDLPIEHPAWDLEANYLARAMKNVTLCFSPERIILGGGVMRQSGLLSKVQQKTKSNLNGYIQNASIEVLKTYIVSPHFGDDAGAVGGFALAQQAFKKKRGIDMISQNEVGQVYTRPWGTYQTIALESGHQVKILTVLPGGRLSLQRHFKRSEHWVVVEGAPTITLGGDNKTVLA